eukprot:GFUD01010972.1.p1 GENE.GFUD01010972.1~~GFUD01010972.1.p1  ORF type:complete len:353 (+),score=77.13 GFUD01010972.1:24-1082(+)
MNICLLSRNSLQRTCLMINKRCGRMHSSQLSAFPQESLIDEKVTIEGKFLPKHFDVTLETSLKDESQRMNFQSACHYRTDSQGVFCTNTQAPAPGSAYNGVHSSGPLWSAQPQKGSMVRLWPHDIMKSLEYNFLLKNRETGEVLASEKITKSFVNKDVRRIVVKTGRIRGTLFVPPKPGPGIITLYGGVNKGKVPEDRAAMLASQGFVTLALAFFGVDDLPEVYSTFDMEYFEEAVDYLLALPEVSHPQVGLCGISTGGNISLAMMMFLTHKIGACAVFGASFVSAPGLTVYKDKVIEGSEFVPLTLAIKGGLDEIRRNPQRQILYERSEAPLLIIVGQEDGEKPRDCQICC